MSRELISHEDFTRFRDIFYHRTGIFFEVNKRYFVDKRLMERMDATGSRDFRSYLFLLNDPDGRDEWQELVNIMTVNETYFFREAHQFRMMVRDLLPDVTQRLNPPRTVRIWVIPSSSGEEAYSVAIYLLEYWEGLATWDVEIVASDIDTEVLRAAERGIYTRRSVQHVPPALLTKYFTPVKNGYLIHPTLRDSIRFTRVNLLNPDDLRAYSGFDLVFCRNLLIYFDDRARQLAADALYQALNDGGFLLLGHSESMSRISSRYHARRFSEGIVYQKPMGATPNARMKP
ncbi:MAG: protein-glutamate O-methyltransferase CheR [Firmicutes bacterium]|nr:protein-glutamate O-methyltransferase CheR [Bacillota bacterium]